MVRVAKVSCQAMSPLGAAGNRVGSFIRCWFLFVIGFGLFLCFLLCLSFFILLFYLLDFFSHGFFLLLCSLSLGIDDSGGESSIAEVRWADVEKVLIVWCYEHLDRWLVADIACF